MNQTTTVHAGDVLTRPKALGVVTHVGVAIAPNLILQNTPEKGEHLTTVQEFCAGKPVMLHRTGVNPSIVAARAQAVLASPQKYDLFQNNCEHTATKIIQGMGQSSQLAVFVTIALVGGVLLLASSKS
jgi:hypothetical protein